MDVEDTARAVFDVLPDPVVYADALLDGDGSTLVVRDANPAARVEAVVDPAGRRLTEVFPEHADLVDRYLRVAASGEALVIDDLPRTDPRTGRHRALDIRAVRLPPADGVVTAGVCVTWRDVTPFTAALLASEEAERRYRLVAENASDVVLLRGPDGLTSWISPSARVVLGREPEALVGVDILDLVHPDDVAVVEAVRAQVQSGAQPDPVTVRISGAGAGDRYVSLVSRPIRDADGALTGAASIGLRDIDALVRAELAAAEGEHRLRTVLEGMLDPHAILAAVRDAAGELVDLRIVDTNAAVTTFTGIPRDQLVGRLISQIGPPEEAGLIGGRLGEVIRTGQPLIADAYPFIELDPTVPHRRVDIRAVRIGDGLSLSWRDATQREAMADALVESELRYRLLVENAADVVFRLAPNGRLEWASQGLETLTGWPVSRLVGHDIRDLADPADRERAAAVVDDVIAGHDPPPVRARIRGMAGEVMWISIRARGVRDASGTLTAIVGGWRDVTSEVRAEHALAASESRYRQLAEHAAEVVLQTGPSGTLTWVSPSVTRVLGWHPPDLLGRRAADLIHPDDLPRVLDVKAAVFAAGETSGQVEARFATADGGWRWMSDLGSGIVDEAGEIVGGVDALRDIHEQRLAREALAESEERLRAAIETMLDPWVLLQAVRDPDGRIIDFAHADANDAACRINSLPREELIGSRVLQRFPELGERGTVADYVRVVETGTPLVLDDHPFIDLHTGELHWFDNRGVRVGDGLTLTWRDVTERRRGADALRMSEEHFRLLADNASDVVFRGTPDSRVDWISPSVTDALGWRPAELVGRPTVDLVDPGDRERVAGVFAESHDQDTLAYRARFLTASGGTRWMAVTVRSVRDDTGQLVAWVGAARDVDAEQQAQEALAESERRFRLLAESASDVVYQTDSAGNVVWISPSVTPQLGWRPEDLIGGSMLQYVEPADLAAIAEPRAGVWAGNAASGMLMRVRAADGSRRWVSVAGRPLTDASGAVTGLVIGVRDVDELVRARERAQALADRWQATADGMLDPQILVESVRDESGRVVDFTYLEVNRATGEYLSVPAAGLVGTRLRDSFPGIVESGLLDLLTAAVDTGEPLRLADWAYRNEVLGEERRYDLGANRVGDGLSIAWRDVTDRYQAAHALALSERRFRLLAHNSTDVVLHARDGIVLWVSPSVTTVFGFAPEDWVGTPLNLAVHPDDLAAFEASVAEVSDGATLVRRSRARDRWGIYHWVEAHARPYVDEAGRRDGIIASLRLVDDQVAAEAELDRLARTDALTGLVNRAEGMHRLALRLSDERRTGDRLALAYCDLDDFKSVNDTLGHAAGDLLLRTAAERIRTCLRDGDVVSRIGGDEILLVLDGVHGPEDALAIAEKVRASVARPVPGPYPALRSTVSIGVVLADPTDDVDALIARADRAMYLAKQSGRDRAVLG